MEVDIVLCFMQIALLVVIVLIIDPVTKLMFFLRISHIVLIVVNLVKLHNLIQVV